MSTTSHPWHHSSPGKTPRPVMTYNHMEAERFEYLNKKDKIAGNTLFYVVVDSVLLTCMTTAMLLFL